jgi:ABC-2 type transport system ATP-binding protein
MNEDIAISVKNVSKDFKLPHQKIGSIKGVVTNKLRTKQSFEVQHALKNIDLEIKKGEFFGIVGRNGSGKSTLLKILAGIYQPTKGKVAVHGKLVPFIELGVGFNPELTGRENVYLNGALLGFSEKEIAAMYDEIVGFAELEKFMDQKLKNYSSGMQVRLAFAMAIRSEADILLIDEVLAVGDAEFQRKCFEYFRFLKRTKKTVVFVSHDMSAVQQYCDRALMIEKSEVVAMGKPSIISSKYNRMFASEATKNSKKSDKQGTGISGEERWGDGWAKITTVDAVVEEDSGIGDGHVSIRVKVKANMDIKKPIVGFSIKNSQLLQLLGNNTVRKKIDLDELKKGEVVEYEWVVDNVFNDGTYYVDCTVAHDEATSVSDRWPDAASFVVYRDESTPYTINTNVNFILQNKENRNA